MGRAKLKMELISKEKSRNITFKKRKEGLIRKLHELTTLCDVGASMIIYGPKQEKGPAVEPHIWPENLDQAHEIIDAYKAHNKESGSKSFGLSDFFQDRKRKIEDEVAKLRKKNMESKYPTWLQILDFKTEGQLREFAAALKNKADYVNSRIALLRRSSNQQGPVMDLGPLFYGSMTSPVPLEPNNPWNLACYNAPPPYMVSPQPQMQFSTVRENQDQDIVQYRMKMEEAMYHDWVDYNSLWADNSDEPVV